MRAVSKKRAAQMRQYSLLRKEFLAANPRCQCPRPCPLPAEEVHHMRGRVGADLLDTGHWLALCHGCHQWVTEHPAEALAIGASESRLAVRS